MHALLLPLFNYRAQIVLLIICIPGVAFLLRFLVALLADERKSRAMRARLWRIPDSSFFECSRATAKWGDEELAPVVSIARQTEGAASGRRARQTTGEFPVIPLQHQVLRSLDRNVGKRARGKKLRWLGM